MVRSRAKYKAVKMVMAFMLPYAEEFKTLEKKMRKASEWKGRTILHSQQIRAAEPTENAKKAHEASACTSSELDKLSITIMQAFHRQVKGWEFSSLGEMNAAISNEEWGTGKKIEELGTFLTEEKHKAEGYVKLPVSILGILTLVFCAVTGRWTAAGLIVLAGGGLVMGIADHAVTAIFSKRERALATWEKAAARVRGLAENGNGDDAINELDEKKALIDEISLN